MQIYPKRPPGLELVPLRDEGNISADGSPTPRVRS